MNTLKKGTILPALAGALLASLITVLLSPNTSLLALLAFLGWVIFFLGIQAPFLLKPPYGNCSGWFRRSK